jgi:serine phosphatase RsbU (regulator of sigma subunit)
VDLQNPSGHLYGGEKLMHLLEKHHPLECEELLERIIEETEQFRGARERMDDFTLMLLTRKP